MSELGDMPCRSWKARLLSNLLSESQVSAACKLPPLARRYTRLTIFGHDFLRIRFIHLRLLRRRPFWAHGGKYLNQARILFVALF